MGEPTGPVLAVIFVAGDEAAARDELCEVNGAVYGCIDHDATARG